MKKFWLISILAVATFLRIYQLDLSPPSLFGDELDVGYQAYSLLKTGQDLQGNTWPILIQSLSEYRAPLFIYSDIPFVAIFGLNEWGVRLAAAFWGVLGVWGIYLLVRKIFNEQSSRWRAERLALLSALFLAISPWHIHYSRAGFEVTMLLAFLIFATHFFLKGLEKKYFLIISIIFFALTPYIYSTAVVFMPLLLGLLAILNRQYLRKHLKSTLPAAICLFIILTPFAIQTITGAAGNRFNLISIFSNKDLQEKVTLLQQREALPLGMERVFHNKPAVILQNFTTNYMRAFSPEFLFLNGDPNSRHSIHEMGQMYFFESILLLFSFWVIFNVKLTNGRKLILGWLFIAPIPASLTYDGGFHASRNFLMLVPLMILLSLGANFLIDNIYNKKLKQVLILIIIFATFNFTFYLHRYFIDYPFESSRAWHFGFKEAMHYVDQNDKEYDRVLINNTYEPSLIRFLFWTGYNPDTFHKKFSGDNFDGFSLENKYYFGKFNAFEQMLDRKTLYVASARDDITNPETLNDDRVKLLETVYSPSGEPIFYIITGR